MEKIRKMIYEDHDPYANVELLPYNGFTWENENGQKFFDEIIEQLKPKLIIEIGSWIGGSAVMMVNSALKANLDISELEIVCVDTFLGSVEHLGGVSKFSYVNGRPDLYRLFLSNIIQSGYKDIITPFPMDSQNAMLWMKNKGVFADMIYVDAAHDYRAVQNDLYSASLIIRDGGWIVGDDFNDPEVHAATLDTFGEDKVTDKGRKSIWIK